jgi:perosamine synthetase
MVDLTDFTFLRGRVALTTLLKALQIGPGDEVITQAFTCVAVPEGIMATGARPIYADLEEGGVNLNAQSVENCITSKTKAIVVQHTFGIAADMDALVIIAQHYSISIIEDCCHTLHSKINGKLVGTIGIGSFYSHEWGKPVVVGIGGSLRINDESTRKNVENLYQQFNYPKWFHTLRVRLQYNIFKLLYRPQFYWNLRKTYRSLSKMGIAQGNYNPIDAEQQESKEFSLRMASSLRSRLSHKLHTVNTITRHSDEIVHLYKEALTSKHIQLIKEVKNSYNVFARFPVWASDKQKLLIQAEKEGIEVADWYCTPIHPLTETEIKSVSYEPGSCPKAEVACRHVVSLPTHPGVSHKEAQRISEFLKNW